MSKGFKRVVREIAHSTGKLSKLYRKLSPNPQDYAEFLRRHGNFHAIGDGCYISPGANIQDRPLVSIGNNVWIADCTIVGHDGTIGMINRAYNVRLDKVGKVEIRDNVSICHGAIILPGVTIGPNAIVGAGSVVSRDVPENSIVSGVPAKPVGRVDMMVQMLKIQNREYPWRHLIEARDGAFDPSIQPELTRMRVKYFFGKTNDKKPEPSAAKTSEPRPAPTPSTSESPANADPTEDQDAFEHKRKTAGG